MSSVKPSDSQERANRTDAESDLQDASAESADFDLSEADDETRAATFDELEDARASARGNFDPRLAYRYPVEGGESSARKLRVRGMIQDSMVAQGDININYAPEEQAAELAPPIPGHVLDEIASVYAPPSGFPDLEAQLRRCNLLVLRIHPRWGASTTAIQLLSGYREIHEVKLDAALTELPIESLPKRAGFIIDPVGPDQLAGLGSLDMKRIDQQLAEHESKAVVVLDDSARLRDHGIDRLAMHLETPPPADELVENHLHELIGSPEKVRRLLETDDLEEWLRAIEPDNFDVHLLVALAHDLADAAAGRGTVEDARTSFEERSTRDVEAWIDSIANDAATMTTVCALAVFNGAPYDIVRRAASRLHRSWTEEYGEESESDRKRRSTRRSERLAQARARVAVREPGARRGRSAAAVAEFIDAGYPARVLDYVWREYDDYADLLLSWLQSLTAGAGVDAGIRAATAIGYLGHFDFPRVRREVIGPWAKSGRRDRREQAVAALSMLADSDSQSSQVFNLLKDWCGSDSKPLRATAARALGSAVGHVIPGGPDERLGKLAKKADRSLAVAIGLSLRELMAEADMGRASELIALLDDWAKEPLAGRHRAGVAGFVECARLHIAVQSGDKKQDWPLLLWLAEYGGEPELREGVARLLGHALVAPGFDGAIRAVLRNWAFAAERSEPMRSAMARLCQEAASSSAHATELTYHAKSWRTNERIAPDLATSLLASLHRKA